MSSEFIPLLATSIPPEEDRGNNNLVCVIHWSVGDLEARDFTGDGAIVVSLAEVPVKANKRSKNKGKEEGAVVVRWGLGVAWLLFAAGRSWFASGLLEPFLV